LALNVFCYVSFEDFSKTLRGWNKKLKKDGILKISIVDLYSMASSFANCQISTEDFLSYLWGGPNTRKSSAIDANSLCQILESCGFKLMTKRYDGISFYVEAAKNEN
jgi:hypothetical protein